MLYEVITRTCAMGFNRIVDREYDKLNPRTASRALPAQTVKLSEAWLMVILTAGLFFYACYNLNQLTLMLSPFALGLTLFYSLTKRFTWLCHIVLGLALARITSYNVCYTKLLRHMDSSAENPLPQPNHQAEKRQGPVQVLYDRAR